MREGERAKSNERVKHKANTLSLLMHFLTILEGGREKRGREIVSEARRDCAKGE